jgi:hypothetical protein
VFSAARQKEKGADLAPWSIKMPSSVERMNGRNHGSARSALARRSVISAASYSSDVEKMQAKPPRSG